MAVTVTIDYGSISKAERINETQIKVTLGIGYHASTVCEVWNAYAAGVRFAHAEERTGSVYLTGTVTITAGPQGGTTSVPVAAYARTQSGSAGETGSAQTTYTTPLYPPYTYTITFDPGAGSVVETTRSVDYGAAYGTLPTPTPPAGYGFLGWFTEAEGGTEVTAETLCSGAATLYAQYSPLAILHLVRGGAAETVTDIRVAQSGAVKRVLSVWSVENGVPRQGV